VKIPTPKCPDQDVLNHLSRYRVDVSVGKIFGIRGKEVGSLQNHGYWCVGVPTRLGTRIFRRTHIIWWIATGSWPNQMLDHIDRNKLNDVIGNLRVSTPRDNRNNQGRELPPGVSLYRGTPGSKPYKAQIRANGKVKYLGVFISIQEASEAYQLALKEL